jgi:hypothetical protein
MRNKPVPLALLGIGGVIAMAYNMWAYSALWSEPKQDPTSVADELPESSEEATPAGTVSMIETMTQTAVTKFVAELPPTGRNPFRFGGTGGHVVADRTGVPLLLQGTLVGTHRTAWINQRAHSEGDEIEGHVIERIDVDGVVLRPVHRPYEPEVKP